jgi:DNA-binding beta-propeller fold protein YncE
VASEATDEVRLVRFGPTAAGASARVERRHEVGFHPADPDGPHGLAVAPDGRSYYVSTAHGVPNGYLWRFATADSRLYAYVVNFNLHGDMVPSSVSIVSTAEMLEVARLRTCVMPHGSTLSPDGARHYSACMMDDVLVEIDARAFAVARHFELTPGAEHGMNGPPMSHAMPAGAALRCSPTWAAPSPGGARVFVACNQTNDIVEIDAETWALVRRIPAGEGVYNLAVTRTASGAEVVIATNRRGRSVSFFDAVSGREMDLATFRRVAAVDVGQMSGGIAFWRSEPTG